jgi:hypothetical protein
MSGPKKPEWEILAELLAQQRRDALRDPPMSPFTQALMDALQQPQKTNPFVPSNGPLESALSDLFKTRPSQPQTGGILGSLPPWSSPTNRPFSTPTYAAPKPKQRSTFYSFHYDDVFRVNHVRNAGAILPTDKQRFLTPQDKSLWEKAKNTKPGVLKMMIARGLAGTTVTAVLAGEHTWERPWVRYEIARSLLKGNGLLTVHIDGCECPNNGYGRRGPNPLDFVALGLNRQIYELNARGIWIPYDKLSMRPTAWPKWLPRPSPRHVMPLSCGAPEFDWINDSGRDNLARWTNDAAKAAGR